MLGTHCPILCHVLVWLHFELVYNYTYSLLYTQRRSCTIQNLHSSPQYPLRLQRSWTWLALIWSTTDLQSTWTYLSPSCSFGHHKRISYCQSFFLNHCSILAFHYPFCFHQLSSPVPCYDSLSCSYWLIWDGCISVNLNHPWLWWFPSFLLFLLC